jgi:hypothetical protein
VIVAASTRHRSGRTDRACVSASAAVVTTPATSTACAARNPPTSSAKSRWGSASRARVIDVPVVSSGNRYQRTRHGWWTLKEPHGWTLSQAPRCQSKISFLQRPRGWARRPRSIWSRETSARLAIVNDVPTIGVRCIAEREPPGEAIDARLAGERDLVAERDNGEATAAVLAARHGLVAPA